MIQVKDFENIRGISEVTVFEAIDKVFYIVSYCNVEENVYIRELWCLELKSKRNYQIEVNNPLKLRRDKSSLIVCSNENVFYHLNSVNNDIREMITLPYDIIDFEVNDLMLIQYKVNENVMNSQTNDYRHMGLTSIHKLALYDLDKQELIPLHGGHVQKFFYNAKLDKAVLVAFDLNKKPIYNTIYLLDLTNGSKQVLSKEQFRVGDIVLDDDSSVWMTATDVRLKSRNENKSLIKMSTETGDYESFDVGDISFEEMGVYTDCHQFAMKRGRSNGHKHTFIGVASQGEKLITVGQISQEHSELRTIDSFDYYKDNCIVAGLKDMNLQELYLVGKTIVQLTNHNDWLSKRNVVEPRKIDTGISTWVLEPTRATDKKSPAIVVIHGGPKGMNQAVYSHDMQVLVQTGYYVIFANPSGSDGYGEEFSNIRTVFGQKPYVDMMNCIDDVLNEYPLIDSDKLGVMGGSYGGYLTNYIITHTTRFKAAISARGISSMINSFVSSDIGFEYVYEYMGNGPLPWSDTKAYIEASPLYAADLVETPTLFIHGEKDVRCHVTESLNMYHALCYNDIHSELRIFPGEGHGFVVSGQPKHRYERYKLILEWFDKLLKGDVWNH